MGKKETTAYRPSSAFKIGAIAFTFLILGYQAALFMHRAVQLRVAAARDNPDTVYVFEAELAERLLGNSRDSVLSAPEPGGGSAGSVVVRKSAECFRFDPNTVSVKDLQRLGFTEKQALSIDAYRSKGGRFRRPADFAKSYAVSDAAFERLRPYIDIPLVDINSADSAAFDALPGIGPYFAAKMVSFREELGGYSCKEQLMDIWNFDNEKYKGLSDLICCSPPRDSLALWEAPAEELQRHPYIRSWAAARAIVFFREHNPKSEWSVENLLEASVIDSLTAARLSRCAVKE